MPRATLGVEEGLDMADVYVHCRTEVDGGGTPLSGVKVSLHLPDTYAAVSSGLTNPSGIVFLGDQDAGEYELHLTPPSGSSVSSGNLQKIELVDAEPHVFDVVVSTSGLPVSADEHLCRCSGYFVDPFGTPLRDLTIRLSEAETPFPNLIYYAGEDKSYLVVPRVRTIKTDSNGFASIDLLRGKFYGIYMEGYENLAREIQVPDTSSASLPDVIFPVVDGIEYTAADVPGVISGTVLNYNTPELTLTAGEKAEFTLKTAYRSNLKVAGVLDTLLTSSDNDIISISLTEETLVVEGLSAGTAEVEVARVEPGTGSGISIFPEPAIRGALSVTVNI